MTEGYGDFIKKHRLLSGFKSQRMLADNTGISSATISRIEKEIHKPEVRTLRTLSLYLTTTTFETLMEVCGYSEYNVTSSEKTNLENKFLILDVTNLTPKQLEEQMNELYQKGYQRAFQSSIEWYQGKGMWGIITFEKKD
jgi:transcriptional regulator with XRE-family HTH domain